MNSVFNEQILADKLSKVNSTQQCIESKSSPSFLFAHFNFNFFFISLNEHVKFFTCNKNGCFIDLCVCFLCCWAFIGLLLNLEIYLTYKDSQFLWSTEQF